MKQKSKKTAKSIIAGVLSACMLMSGSLSTVGSYITQGIVASAADVTVVQSGSCGAERNNVTYILYSDGQLVISGNGDMKDYETYDNRDLISPFKNDKSIKVVKIEEGVTSIGSHAFDGCNNIISISIPETMHKIGQGYTNWGVSGRITNIPSEMKGNSYYDDYYGLVGAFTDWGSTGDWIMRSDKQDGIYSVTIEINPGYYTFKVRSNSAWDRSWGVYEQDFDRTNNSQTNCEISVKKSTKLTVHFDTRGIDDEHWPISIEYIDENGNNIYQYLGKENYTPVYPIDNALSNELIEKTRLYTSDGGAVYRKVLESLNENLSRDDIATEAKIAMLNNFYKLFNITDIQEGTAYCLETMNGKRAYDFLTNNENFLSYQFKNYLQDTASGTIARGLMITDGWIFNNELKQWIDPRTYITQETVDIRNYKAMLLSFMNYEAETGVAGDVSEVVGYADKVRTHIEYFAESLDEAAKKNIKKDLADVRAKSNTMTAAQVRQEMKKIWNKYQLTGTIENGKKTYHVKGFNELSKALKISGNLFQIAVTSIDDIMDILNVENKLETIEKYREFLELVANGKDYLPADMVIAANQLLNETIMPYFNQFVAFIYDEAVCVDGIFEVSKSWKKQLTDKLKSKYPKLFEGKTAEFASTFGDAVAVIEISAVVTNAITNVGTTIKDAAYVEAYAYLGQYFSEILRDKKDQFNADQSVENAWDFYDIYNLLFRIRACGENSYLKMCDDSPVTWILSGVGFKSFDIKDRKKYVADTFDYMNNYCFFGLENADQIPESHKFAQKAVIKCPVDVKIYDNSGKLVYTVFDGKEIDQSNTLGRFFCKYDPRLGEYIKIVCLNNPYKYTIKSVGVDSGNVSIETAVVGTDNAVTSSKISGLPIEKSGIITLDVQTGNYTDDQNGDGKNEYTGKLNKTDTSKIISVKSIKLSTKDLDLKVGEKKVVGVIVNPSNATFTDFVWESSDESIAVVENGAIKGISVGEAKITVSTSDRKITAFCTIKIKPYGTLGDTNNDESVDIADALMIARYDAGLIQLDETQLSVSDVNKDDSVDIADALMIARYDAGLIDKL